MHCSSNISRGTKNYTSVICRSMANTRYAYRILFGKPERKSPLGRAKCGLKDIRCEEVDRVYMEPVAEGYRYVINLLAPELLF